MNRKSLWCFLVCVFAFFSLHAEEAKKPKRIYVDVVGDLPHMGHIEFYKQAKAFGDYLIVGVLSDEDVASYKRVPILTLKERVAIIESLKIVDEVIPAAPLSPSEAWLKDHKIDLVVHGDDASDKMLQEQYQAPIKMGIFKTVPYTKGISTTEILQRVRDRFAS